MPSLVEIVIAIFTGVIGFLAKLLIWLISRPRVICKFYPASSNGFYFRPFASTFYPLYPPPQCGGLAGSLEIRLTSKAITRWRVRKLTLLYEKIAPSTFVGEFCVKGVKMKDFGVLELRSREWFYQTVENVDLILSSGQGVVVPTTLPKLQVPKRIAPRYILRVELEPIDKPSWFALLGFKKLTFTKECALEIQELYSRSRGSS